MRRSSVRRPNCVLNLTKFRPASIRGQAIALRRAVLIGHSMGGLVSKLTVSHSGEDVWNSIANLPLENVATDEMTRANLAERLFFDPHPLVQRAVFVATPHRGSALAGRAVGKIAGALVSESEPAYEQIMRDNVSGFKESVSRRMPTSIDFLNPDQPFLDTIGRLRVSRCVTLHSIIGDGVPLPASAVLTASYPSKAPAIQASPANCMCPRHTAASFEIPKRSRRSSGFFGCTRPRPRPHNSRIAS